MMQGKTAVTAIRFIAAVVATAATTMAAGHIHLKGNTALSSHTDWDGLKARPLLVFENKRDGVVCAVPNSEFGIQNSELQSSYLLNTSLSCRVPSDDGVTFFTFWSMPYAIPPNAPATAA